MQTLDQTGTIDKAVNFNLFVLFTSQVADHIQVVRQLGCWHKTIAIFSITTLH